ncbi:ImmA/IrrE family metallo-endopeptidase [Clostridium sp.]|jgi:chorismate mutase|uniref:ImmA/IrrE family metallo-endopeptidase n=1 Tax=Clostridium sp. TaxID=1506 RepID=UPI002FDCF1D7
MGFDDLINEASKEGVNVIEMNFKGKSKGYYLDNVIAINAKLETTAEKRCTLIEEIGHLKTSSGNILDAKNTSNRKQEKRARNWAYEKLAGIISIVTAFEKGIRSKYDLAEYLNITENFLEEAIQHYREKYGVCYEIDTYVIYFEPNFGIFKKF